MADLDYVIIVGRFGIPIADGDDVDDDPDMIWCDAGEISLEPLVAETKVVGGLPVPWTGGQSTFTPTIDAEGYSTWRGQHFIKTIDLTSTKVNPRIVDGKATHRVTFRNVKAGALDVKFEQRSVRLAADMAEALDATAAAAYGLPTGTLVCDLTKLLPVPVANSVPIVVGPQGPPGDPTLTDEVTATNIETGDLTKAALGSEIATTGTPAEVAVAANIATRIRAGLGIVNALDPLYGIKGDGTTDDTVAINTLLAACPRGTHVLFPRAEYRITDYILMKRDVHIHGAGVSANIGDVAELEGGEATFIGVPRNAPYLVGTVFRQDGAGKDGFRFTGPGTPNVTDIGLRFGPDIMLSNTGHGFVCTPVATSGHYGNGLWGSTWKDVMVFGHDGNHYAFKVTNGIYNNWTNLSSFGGGGLHLINDGIGSASYGNWVFPNICVQLFATGTAHGVLVNNVTAQFNFLLFGRLQIMIYDRSSVFAAAGVPNAAVQKHIEGLGVGMIENLRIEQPDFESNVGAGPASALSSGALTWGPGFFNGLGTGNADFWRGRTRNTPMVIRSPRNDVSTLVGYTSTGVGTGGSATAERLNDAKGTIVIATGTGPVAGKVATVTFSKPWPDNTEPDVLLTPNGPGWSSKGAYVTNVTATSFDLYVETALTASTTYRMNFFAVG